MQEEQDKKENNEEEVLDVFIESCKDVFEKERIEEQAKQEGKTSEELVIQEAEDWEQMKIAMSTYHLSRFNRVLQNMGDDAFAKTFVKTLPYFRRPLSSQNTGPSTVVDKIIVNVNRGDQKQVKTIEVK